MQSNLAKRLECGAFRRFLFGVRTVNDGGGSKRKRGDAAHSKRFARFDAV